MQKFTCVEPGCFERLAGKAAARIHQDLTAHTIVELTTDTRAIAEADRKLRHELESISDPRLRAECLAAF